MMHSTRKITIIYLSVLFITFTGLSETTQAKSVYAIIDRSSTIRAYKINGEKIEEQIDVQNLDDHGGAVGLALDPDSAILFVTFEGSNIIEMVNAKTMISEQNPLTVPGASNLAGIAFDKSKQKLYVVERRDNRLYVYLWNSRTKTLTLEGGTYKTLENIGEYPNGAYGISLDESNNRLFVTNATKTVRWYDTNDPNSTWTCQGTIVIVVNSYNRSAIGIAIDSTNRYMYTGFFTGTGGDHNFLVRTDITDINTPSFTEHNVGAYVIGIATDEDTGLVYVTTKKSGDDIEVYDTATFPSDPCYTETADIYQPADIIVRGDVSYKEPFLNLTLVKEDNIGDCVEPNNEITYTITYSANGDSDTNVVITDYLPIEVDYENIFDPNYDDGSHSYTWNIGTLEQTDWGFVTLTVKVNALAEPSGTISNCCEIEGEEYRSLATVDTDVCCWDDSEIIYVDKTATSGSNIGISWQNAYTDLQDALGRARVGCGSKIWVAAGTYKPTDETTRSISFEMIDDVSIYGGFPTGGGPRNPRIYQTILSGDIDDDSNPTYNSYHVVKCENNINNAILDGFTITGGNASSSSVPNCYGGGIYIYNSSPTIKNCIFSNNSAYYNGGGMWDSNSNPNITNCIFSGNTATYSYGGGIYNRDGSSPTIENCIFSNNSAGTDGGGLCNSSSDPNVTNCIFYKNQTTLSNSRGGGINNYDSSPKLVNCTFSANSAPIYGGKGGGMYNSQSSPVVTNCIFWGNLASSDKEIYNAGSNPTVSYCDIEQGNPVYPGEENIKVDPCFFNPVANNYHIAQGSPCIDRCNPNFNPNPGETDIDGEPRKVDGDSNGTSIVDMGADEYYWSPADFDMNEIVNFKDYAKFANAWQSSLGQTDYNDIYDLEDNNTVDYNDLKLFCDDWLWTPAWDKTMDSMMMGEGMGGGMSQSISQSVSLTEFGKQLVPELTAEGLIQSEAVYQSEPVEEKQPEPITQQEIEDTLKWLDEVRLNPEVREAISEDDWLEFVELVKSSLQ